MIIVNLKGGLGNQMFQYAAGRALAIKSKTDLKLSDHSYSLNKDRDYKLNVFNIKAELATPEELKKIKYPFGIISKGIRFINGRYLKKYNTVYFKEKYTKPVKNFFLDGYFQSEKYFIDYENEIKEDFKLKTELSNSAKEILEKIKNSEDSVSVHFRRTDYVNHSDFNIKDDDYQIRAIQKIKSDLPNARLFIFSDDIRWVKENVNLHKDSVFVSSPEIKDYEELYLMSQCKNNIIANSSFSWWGAWLNNNPKKIVIAPKTWAVGIKSYRFKDIVPNNWIRI